MLNFKDFLNESYEQILGLSGSFTPDELKQAYRAASMKHHPDRGGSTDMMQQVNRAYAELSKKATLATSFASREATRAETDQKYRDAGVFVKDTLNKKFDRPAFVSYFEKLTGKKFTATSKDSVTQYAMWSEHEFVSDDREVKFAFTVSVQMHDVVYSKVKLGGGDVDFFNMSVSTTFFANNRKQTLVKGNYSTKTSLNILSDPSIVFPSPKITKGLGNVKTKFTKKDMFLSIESKLDGDRSDDDVFIPIGNDLFILVRRSTMMRQGMWDLGGGLYSKTKFSYRSASKSRFIVYRDESEETLATIIELVGKLKGKTDVDQIESIIRTYK